MIKGEPLPKRMNYVFMLVYVYDAHATYLFSMPKLPPPHMKANSLGQNTAYSGAPYF